MGYNIGFSIIRYFLYGSGGALSQNTKTQNKQRKKQKNKQKKTTRIPANKRDKEGIIKRN